MSSVVLHFINFNTKAPALTNRPNISLKMDLAIHFARPAEAIYLPRDWSTAGMQAARTVAASVNAAPNLIMMPYARAFVRAMLVERCPSGVDESDHDFRPWFRSQRCNI